MTEENEFPFDGKYTFLDVENPNINTDTVCAISLIIVENRKVVQRHTELINPKTFFSGQNISVHKIRPQDVKNARTFREFYRDFSYCFSEDYILAGHNINSDISIINRDLNRFHERIHSSRCLDTSDVMKTVFYHDKPEKGALRLKNAAAALHIPLKAHEAQSDVNACFEIVTRLYRSEPYSIEPFIRKIPESKIYTHAEMKQNALRRKRLREQKRLQQKNGAVKTADGTKEKAPEV